MNGGSASPCARSRSIYAEPPECQGVHSTAQVDSGFQPPWPSGSIVGGVSSGQYIRNWRISDVLLEGEAQTVRGLAAKLNVSKPAITRALDRLAELDLVRRKTDPLYRRSVLNPARRFGRDLPTRPQKDT